MYLTEKQKQDIWTEFNSFKDTMYADKSKKEREALGQFFTPADLTIQILEQLDCTYEEFLDSDVIDPTSGSGNLLAAALIIGVDPHRVFGNEYDTAMVKLCRERLNKVCDMLGKPHIRDWQIHKGDARDSFCLTEFGPDYKVKLEDHYRNISRVNKGEFEVFDLFAEFKELTKEQEEFLREVD